MTALCSSIKSVFKIQYLLFCFFETPFKFLRHTPDIWPSYDRFFPSLWESFHSPWYRKPALGTSYTSIEFTETGEGTRKKETKDVEGEKETPKSAEKFVDDRESFKISFDVSKFKPEEITIRSEHGELVVEGKQEMKNDEGYSTRQFVRSYSLPRNIDRDSFQSRLSKEGLLSIEAKKLQPSEAKDNFIKIETEE